MNIITKNLLTATIFTATVIATLSPAHADTIYGLYADANYWNTEIQSSYTGTDSQYENQAQTMLSASFEHFVPLVPNVRIRHTTLDASGTFDNKRTELGLTSTDAVAYYEILDNIISADIGVGAKFLEGDWTHSNMITDLSRTLPMGYAAVGAKLPFTELTAKAEVGIARGKAVEATDALAEIKYNFIDSLAMDLGVKAGYRMMKIDYEDIKDKALNTNFKGPYMGLELHF